MGFWAKSLRIFNTIRANGRQSVRRLALRTGFSKSSVHRHRQAMKRRNRHPESWVWETEEGHRWLLRLVVAALFTFGLKRGVGAETISEFFGRLRLEAHIGCSPSALRRIMAALETVLLETAATWEHDGVAAGEIRPIIGAVDETFLERMMLVFMDLASGYVLAEEVAADRRYATWYAVVKARLATLGVGVRYMVSDRAKALITLAETGLACLSVPDFFHLLQDLTKSYALAIFSRLRHAPQALQHAQERLAACQEAHPDGADVQHAQAVVEAREAEVQRWQHVRSDYRHHLEHLSLIMHPWRLVGSRPQTSHEGEAQLQAEVAALETLVETPGVAHQEERFGQGPQATRGRRCPRGRVVAGGLARCAVPGCPDAELAGLGCRVCAATDVLAGTPGAHAVPATQSQAISGVARQLRRRLKGIPSPTSWPPRSWRDGKPGRPSMPEAFSGPPRRLKGATARCRSCTTTSVACPNAATRCGRCYITSTVVPRTGVRPPHGFSGTNFRTSLRRCSQKSMMCHDLVNATRLWR